MIRIILVLTFSMIICSQSLDGQILESQLREYAKKEADGWSMKLNLSNYKAQKLSEILLNYKIREGEAVLNGILDFEDIQKVNIKEKEDNLKKLFSSQEYQLYLLFNKYSSMDRIEYLKNLIEEYSKDEELINAIVKYREQNILPILRVHRGELEKKISKADKEALSILRVELYETLDKCAVDCKAKHTEKHANISEHYKSLEDVLFKEITSQVKDKMSPMNHLLQITRKYEEDIHVEKSHFENKTDKWNADMAAIHKQFILGNHIDAFRKTLESNSVASWQHLRFDAFFMLLDPSTEDEAKKILKLGMIVLPHLEI